MCSVQQHSVYTSHTDTHKHTQLYVCMPAGKMVPLVYRVSTKFVRSGRQLTNSVTFVEFNFALDLVKTKSQPYSIFKS